MNPSLKKAEKVHDDSSSTITEEEEVDDQQQRHQQQQFFDNKGLLDLNKGHRTLCLPTSCPSPH